MNPKVWNILHDGRIKRISGSIPGGIEFLIEIEYLRRMFSLNGDSIFLTLKDCTFFEYQGYAMVKEKIKCSDFKDFLKQEPIIHFCEG